MTHLRCVVGQRVPGRVERDVALLGELDQVVLAFLVRLGLPGFDRAAGQRLGLVGHDEAVVDADDAAEAAAGFAGAHRRIEREQRGHRIAVRQIAVRAMQFARIFPALDAIFGGSLSSTTCRFTRPRPTRSAVSIDSMTRARSALPSRRRSCTTSSVSPCALVDARVALCFQQLRGLRLP